MAAERATTGAWVSFVAVDDDNPHVCILDDSQPCLACRLIEVLGEDRRVEALNVAAAMGAGPELRADPTGVDCAERYEGVDH